MSKLNISFNNKKYEIDESALSSASAALKTHLSTVMNGTGATINLDGTDYSVDSTKLSNATSAFVTYLNSISGNGSKVTIGGVEYGVDSDKIAGAISELEGTLNTLSGGSTPDAPTEERLEGDGAEFYTMAPTALSFRSTAPLNELQEIQINGVTVDPSNYTLEEGSTIVTFPIDYLKTLNVGNYEVAVASDNKTVKGDFSVKAPETNNHGFYYNQPYSAEVPSWGKVVFFIREDGTYDLINGYGVTSTNTYTVDGDSIVALDDNFGAFHCTILSNGTEIYCAEVQTSLKLSNDTSFAADDDYFYVYKEDLGGYEVKCIDKTKAEYGAIKTGINGIDTVKLADEMFNDIGLSYNHTLMKAPEIPNTVISISSGAFYACDNLASITIPDSVTSIGYFAFRACNSLTSITIPDSVTSIGEEAFAGCENLTSVVIGNGVTTISHSAFLQCSSLTSIVIPDSVTSIGGFAFHNCDGSTSVVIGDSVTSIGDYAFSSCSSLTSIAFNGTTAQWSAITKGENWNSGAPATYVHCSDGQVAL